MDLERMILDFNSETLKQIDWLRDMFQIADKENMQNIDNTKLLDAIVSMVSKKMVEKPWSVAARRVGKVICAPMTGGLERDWTWKHRKDGTERLWMR